MQVDVNRMVLLLQSQTLRFKWIGEKWLPSSHACLQMFETLHISRHKMRALPIDVLPAELLATNIAALHSYFDDIVTVKLFLIHHTFHLVDLPR